MQDETNICKVSNFVLNHNYKFGFVSASMNVCKIVISNILFDKSFPFYGFLIQQTTSCLQELIMPCLKNRCMQL